MQTQRKDFTVADVWQSLNGYLIVHFTSLVQKINSQLFHCNFISPGKNGKLSSVGSRVPQNINH